MQVEGELRLSGVLKEDPAPASYRWVLAFFVAFLMLSLLALVDFRRGFIFPHYWLKTPYFAFSQWHLVMLAAGLAGMLLSHRGLRRREVASRLLSAETYVKWLAVLIFGLLVVDLFLYRGVAAARAVAAGKLGAAWLEALGVTGWWRPLALAVSYMLTVWHATFLGVLLAGLALTVLPRYLMRFFSRNGLGGSLFGAAFALPQPFCSCCASVIAPSLVRKGASNQFALAFVVGAPMLNITSLILAVSLLPAPYAFARIGAGLLLTIPVTYAVAWAANRWGRTGGDVSSGKWTALFSRWLGLYCRVFHLEDMVRDRPLDTPSRFLSTWLSISLRIALLLVPTLFIMSAVTAVVVQVLPDAFANNGVSVVFAAVAGTVLMTSTWTEIPVAQQMISAGLSGPAATMLVVLPPVSLPCLMLLGGATGRFRAIALLALAVMAIGIGVGLAFL